MPHLPFPNLKLVPPVVELGLRYLGATALIAACSPGDTGPGSTDLGSVVGSQGLFSLLAMETARTVHEQPEDFPVEQGHMRAGPNRYAGGGPEPCLVMRPPCDLSYRLPDLPPGARLEFALGVRRNAYRGQGHVLWTITLDSEVLDEVQQDCSASVTAEDQVWLHCTLDLPHAGELRFRVDYEGDWQRGPPVGLAILRVAVPFEAARQVSSAADPNIVLVVVDTLRADALGCLGNPRPTTPIMDRLAREGALFQQAYSSAPWTIPGTASILTGLSIPEHGLGDSDSNSLSERLDTLATVLARSGFTTAGFSCNPLIDSARNFHRGFATFQTLGWKPVGHIEGPVLDFLAQVGPERFFLYLQPTDPHVPYRPLDAHLKRLGIGEAGDVYDEKARAVLDRWYAGGDVDRARLELTNKRNLDLYDAETAEVDRFLGALLERLEREGLADRTLICITADHGEEFLEHGLVGHFNQLYSESVHVPLILWGPGVPAGLRVTAPTENRHVAPTLLRAAGVDLPAAMAGPSLLSAEDREVLEGQGVFLISQKGRRGNFSTRESVGLGALTSLIDGDWQLIEATEASPGNATQALLFNLAQDPRALTNLAAQDPLRVESMRVRIAEWLARGRAARPELVPTSEQTLQLMREIGYIGNAGGNAERNAEGNGEGPGGESDSENERP